MSKKIVGVPGVSSLEAVALAAIASLGSAGVAFSQEPNGGKPADGTVALEEIVVTATRREATVQEVPYNIQAIAGDTLEQLNITEFRDVARGIPGVSIVDDGPRTGYNIALRGIRTGAGGGTTSSYLDDIQIDMPYRGNPLDIRLLDLERVEVLRGPQGTLYGANAIGGTLRYITRKPSLQTRSMRAGAEVSSTRRGSLNHNFSGSADLPLVQDKVGLRLSAGVFDNDGYIDNITLDRNNTNFDKTTLARAALLVKPTDALTINASYNFQRQRFGETETTREELGGFANNYDHEGWMKYTNHLSNISVGYDFGVADLVSSTSYIHERNPAVQDGTFAVRDQWYGTDFIPAEELPDFTEFTERQGRGHAFTEEVRLVSKGEGGWDWTVGGYYTTLRSKEAYQEHVPIPFAGQAAFEQNWIGAPLNDDKEWFISKDETFKESALFGELTRHVTDQWQVTGGVRAFEYKQTGDFYQIDQWFGFTTGAADPRPRDAQGFARTVPFEDETEFGEAKDKDRVWRLNTSYAFTKDALAYLNVAQGYRPGGFNYAAASTQIPVEARKYQPDEIVSYEVGGKFAIANGRAYLSTAVFYIDWTDIQTTVRTPLGFSYQGNAGKATSQGVELELQTRDLMLAGLSASIGYSLTDAQLSETVDRLGFNGDPVPFVARHNASIMLDYAFNVGAGMRAGVNLMSMYNSGYHTAFGPFTPRRNFTTGQFDPSQNYQYFKIDDSLTTDLNFRLQRNAWTARLFVHNLTDEDVARNRRAGFSGSPYLGDTVFSAHSRPRTVGIGLNYEF